MNKCCVNCFDIQELIEYILVNGKSGICPVCGSSGIHVIAEEEISQFLKKYLLQSYTDMWEELQNIERSFTIAEEELADQGLKEKYEHALYLIKEEMGLQSLEEIFIEDKEIFSDRLDEMQQKKILKELFDNQDITKKYLIPKMTFDQFI